MTAPISDVTNQNVFYVFNSITWSPSRIDDRSSQGLVVSLPEHLTRHQAELPCGKPGQGLSLVQCMQ
jgi:hypothetical protein